MIISYHILKFAFRPYLGPQWAFMGLHEMIKWQTSWQRPPLELGSFGQETYFKGKRTPTRRRIFGPSRSRTRRLNFSRGSVRPLSLLVEGSSHPSEKVCASQIGSMLCSTIFSYFQGESSTKMCLKPLPSLWLGEYKSIRVWYTSSRSQMSSWPVSGWRWWWVQQKHSASCSRNLFNWSGNWYTSRMILIPK